MTTTKRNILKRVLAGIPPGSPVTSADLARLGASPNLATYYVRAGWLHRIAHGVFMRPADTLLLQPALRLLEQRITGLHIGGKSALERHGIQHYVLQRPTLWLYGWDTAKLPTWFQTSFPSTYVRKRLFDEHPASMLHVHRQHGNDSEVLVSSPERAFLELISEMGTGRMPSDTLMLVWALDLTDGTYTFRSKVLSELFKKCTSVTTIRICLLLGRGLKMPWVKKLNPASLPAGSEKSWGLGHATAQMAKKSFMA